MADTRVARRLHRRLRALTSTLGALAALAGCTDAPLGARSRAALGERRLTRADSLSRRLLEAPGALRRNAIPADPACTDAAAGCAAFLSAAPGFFQGADQPGAIELTFAGPVLSVTVTGAGAISCDGTYGELLAYGGDGSEVGRATMSLIDPADCSPVDNPDNVTFGASATVTATQPIARVVVLPMAPVTFPVFDLTGRASATYTVVYGAGASAPQLALSCTPVPVTRGQVVRCEAGVSPASPFTVTRLRATGKGFRSEDFPNTAVTAGDVYAWEGMAVADTRVRVEVTAATPSGTRTLTREVSFDVQPRIWPVPQLTGAMAVLSQLDPNGQMQAYPTNGVLGGSRPVSPATFFQSVPVSRATGGPNRGLAILATPFTVGEWEVYLHPGLDPVPAGLTPGQPGYALWHRWHDDQNGRGSGTCTASVFAVLVPEVRRHEGVTRSPNSHWGVAGTAYASLSLADAIERVYVDSPLDDPVRQLGFDAWLQFHNGQAYRSLQSQYDQRDYPIIQSAIGCGMDLNPNDP